MSSYAENEHAPIDLRSVVAHVWQRRFRIILVTVLLCAIAFLLISLVPKTYESSASILVESRENIFTRATNDTGNGGAAVSDAVVMSSQVELIQSSDTMLEVIRALNLEEVAEFNGTSTSPLDPIMALLGRSTQREQGNEQKVLAALTKAVTVIQERDSRIVSILVRAQDPELAAKIANTIADTHVNRRAGLSIDDTADASRWLEEEIANLRVRVVDAESKVARFRIENDLFVGTNNTSLLDQQLSNISAQITTAQERRNSARSRATLIRNLLNAGQSIEGVAEVQNAVIIQRLSQDKARLQGERAQLSATLLPNHPQVRSISAQIAAIDQQILHEGRSVADAMMAEAGIEEGLVASLQDDLARLKISASSAATSTVELQELEREASAQSALLQTYLLRYREASGRTQTGAVLPDVRVVNLALPALKAAAPKSTMILIAVAIVSIAVQVGGILFGELTTQVPTHVPTHTRRNDVHADRSNDPQMTASEQNVAPEPEANPLEQHQPSFDSSNDQLEGEVGVSEQDYDGFGETGVAAVPVQDTDQLFPNDHSVNPMAANQDISDHSSQVHDVDEGQAAEQGHERVQFAQAEVDDPVPDAVPQKSSEPLSTFDQDFIELADALCTGHERLVFLAAYDRAGDCTGVGEMLLADVMASGRSIAIVDAGSGVISTQLGISDLAAGIAEFGDVVFPNEGNGLTEVYWGRRSNIASRSDDPAVLVQALCDICDVVLVFAGSVGVASNLPLFAGLDGTLALVASIEPEYQAVQSALDDVAELGFERSRLLIAPKQHVDVA